MRNLEEIFAEHISPDAPVNFASFDYVQLSLVKAAPFEVLNLDFSIFAP